MTEAERKLWRALRSHRFHGLQFRRQAPCGPYIADFLCHAAKLVVEVRRRHPFHRLRASP
ncbi:MAG: DUF559 domain-containing protein [Methylocystis sp.]